MANGVAEGAKAGAVFGPWGAAAGAVLGGVADVASSGGGPQQQSAAVDARSFMDGSGWVVSTGSGKSTGGARQQDAGSNPLFAPSIASAAYSAQPFMQGATQAGGGWLLPLLVLGLIVWKVKQ